MFYLINSNVTKIFSETVIFPNANATGWFAAGEKQPSG
jgi:hypothetical protein